jgi:tRNA modification GTPase
LLFGIKKDLFLSSADEERLQKLCRDFALPLRVSSQSHEGIQMFIDHVLKMTAEFVYRQPGEVLLTKREEVEAIEGALPHLQRAAQTQAEELFVLDLRHALESLAPLIGETPSDELLGRLFGQFCIGK